MEQLIDMEQLKSLSPEKQSQVLAGIRQQAALANAQTIISALSDKCTAKCITAPGSYLTSSDKQCLQRCMDRYMDTWNVVSVALRNRFSQEMSDGGALSSVAPSSSTGSFGGLFGGNSTSDNNSDEYGTAPTFS